MDEIPSHPLEQDNLREAFLFLQKETPLLCEDICRKQGIKTPYEISFKNFYGDPEHEEDDIVLSPGNPPQLIIADLFVLQCLTAKKKYYYYKHRLEWALERIYKVHRTLYNLVPLTKALALKRDAKQWARTTVPGLIQTIEEKYLTIEFSVEVTDVLTGNTITLNGDNPYELKQMAVKRLSKMIFEREEFDEFYETMKEIKLAQSSSKPIEITVGGADEETRVGIKYE